jgi:hypothetical protein
MIVRTAAADRPAATLPPATSLPNRSACHSAKRLFPSAQNPAISTRPQIPVQNQAVRFATIHAVSDDPRTYPPGFSPHLDRGPVCRLEKLSPIDTPCPIFPVTVSAPARFWKPRTNSSPNGHGNLPLLSTLPPTTTTTTGNIYPFTLFLRSILLPGISLLTDTSSAPRKAALPSAQDLSATTRSLSPCAQHRRITQDAP